jgi:thiol-disulfide isomerase/thioredoxin
MMEKHTGSCTECEYRFVPKNDAEKDWWDSQTDCPDCKAELPQVDPYVKAYDDLAEAFDVEDYPSKTLKAALLTAQSNIDEE